MTQRRIIAFLVAVLLFATPLFAATKAAEKWYEAYERGVAAVNTRNYRVGAEALQKAISEMPTEALNARTRKELITYVPHFWLGIAKFNLDDVEGALREWRISEDQGVVAKTEYYARMQDWVGRAQTERQRKAQTAASVPKKAADEAISAALQMQLEALSSGGDRSEKYLAAQRKLTEARGQFQKAGTDVNAYRVAAQTAEQAASLFKTAADDGRKSKAARAAAPPPVKKTPAVQVAAVVPPPLKLPDAQPIAPPVATSTAETVLTEAEATKRIAEQEAKRKKIEESKKPLPATAVVDVTPMPRVEARPDLRPAFRAFAAGNLHSSEQLLTGILASQPAAEAFLLRGCARYTRAMLSRKPDVLLLAATDDFRAALERNRALRLDRNAFSPKLIAFFEQVRQRL
jgi:hypothetical protein